MTKFMDGDFEALTTKCEVHIILISINIKCGIELCHHLLRIVAPKSHEICNPHVLTASLNSLHNLLNRGRKIKKEGPIHPLHLSRDTPLG
jgi:hypothetical protein